MLNARHLKYNALAHYLPKTGATHCNAQLGLPDKDRAIKGLGVCKNSDVSAIRPANRSGFMLLSTVPRGMDHMKIILTYPIQESRKMIVHGMRIVLTPYLNQNSHFQKNF